MKTNKTKTIVLIILLSILCMLLLGFMIAVLCGVLPIWNFNFGTSKVSENLAFEEVYDINFQEISVDVSVGNIEVLPSNDSRVHVAIYSDYELFDIDDTKSRLSIIFSEEEGFHFSFPKSRDLVRIYLPDTSNIEVFLATDYGDVSVLDFSNANFDINANMGDISVTQANSLSIASDMGDVSIGDVCKLTVTQDMGDIEVANVTEKVSIDSEMGNVSIEKLNLVKDSKIILSLGDLEITSITNAYVDATTDLGDIEIKNNNREAAYVLTVESDMGDVRIGTVRELDAVLDLGNLEVTSITESLSIEADMGKVSLDEVHLLSDSTITLSLGDLDIKRLSNAYVDAKTDLGDIDVENNDRNAPYTLTIKNDMGDVTIG